MMLEAVRLKGEGFRPGALKIKARQISNAARGKSEAAKSALKQAYHRLVDITKTTVKQAQTVVEVLKTESAQAAHRLLDTLETFIARTKQVLDQTRRRVFQKETVKADEKIVSLFEPHTAIIRRQRVGKPTKFGRKVWLDEVDGGLVTQ